MACESCGEKPKKCNKDFTKAVIEINNPEQITLMRRVVIPASMGDDTTVLPVVGKYKNVLLFYEANSKSYLYSSDGIPTLLANGLTDYEQAVNLPQINGVTLMGDKTATQLGLQDKLTAGANISIDTDNVISAVDTTYGPATDSTIGLVKPGDGLEVASDGTLSVSDIEQYAHFFDTVADMKAATNLKSGDYAKTGGFHIINDGGGALYKIANTGTANEMDVIAVGGLYANLDTFHEINVKQLGAYGDGENDDTTILNYAFSNYKWRVVYIPTGNYLVTNTINIVEGRKIYGDGKFASTIRYLGSSKAVEISNLYYGVLTIKDLSVIKDGNYTEGDTTSVGINISKGANNRDVSNLYIENVVVRYFGINFNCSTAGALLNTHFKNCNFEGGYENCHIVGGFNNYFTDCRFGEGVQNGYFQQSGEGKFINCSFEENKRAVRLANSGGSYTFIDCFFENTDRTEGTNASAISIQEGSLALIDNILIVGCHFYGCYRQVYLSKVKRVTFINNTMNNPGLLCVGHNYTNPDIVSITYINNNFAIEPYKLSTFVHFIDEDVADTGWQDVDVSGATRGTFHNFKVRRIGKIVYWNGYLDNVTDSDINQSFGITLPTFAVPGNPASIVCVASMSQGNQGDYSKIANFRIGDNYLRLLGYSATSNALNQIDLASISYIGG